MDHISRVDDWLAKTLFFPPIIALCQLLDRNQFYLARCLQMVGGTINIVVLFMLFGWWSPLFVIVCELRTLVLLYICTTRDRDAILSRKRIDIGRRTPVFNIFAVVIHLGILGFCISDPDLVMILLSISTHLLIWVCYAFDLPEVPPRLPKGKLAWQ